MSLQAIIIDDSDLARASLRSDIEEFCPEVIIRGEANGVIEGAKLVQKVKPNLIFLDIEMGELTGFDLLDVIGDTDAQIIFVTGSKEYAIKAFQVNAIDYLLKPIDPDLLISAVAKIKETISNEKREVTLSFHTSEEVRWAKSIDIIRIQAEGNYSTVYFADGSKLLVTKTLKEYNDKLSNAGFIRVHQSHLVNESFIRSFVKTEGGYLLMENGDQVSVSVRKRTEVLSYLEERS